MRAPKWLGWTRMTHGEYRANLNGLGIFFGAVLGFVMAGTEALAPRDFTLMLFVVAAIVITILYVSNSPYRLAYGALGALMIATLPQMLGRILSDGAPIPPHLQPTLGVWLAITVAVEFLPRDKTMVGAMHGDD